MPSTRSSTGKSQTSISVGEHRAQPGPLWDRRRLANPGHGVWPGLVLLAVAIVALGVWAVVRRDGVAVLVSVVGLGLVVIAPALRPPIGVVPATVGVVPTFTQVPRSGLPGGSSFIEMLCILAFGIVYNSLAVNAGRNP